MPKGKHSPPLLHRNLHVYREALSYLSIRTKECNFLLRLCQMLAQSASEPHGRTDKRTHTHALLGRIFFRHVIAEETVLLTGEANFIFQSAKERTKRRACCFRAFFVSYGGRSN